MKANRTEMIEKIVDMYISFLPEENNRNAKELFQNRLRILLIQ